MYKTIIFYYSILERPYELIWDGFWEINTLRGNEEGKYFYLKSIFYTEINTEFNELTYNGMGWDM